MEQLAKEMAERSETEHGKETDEETEEESRSGRHLKVVIHSGCSIHAHAGSTKQMPGKKRKRKQLKTPKASETRELPKGKRCKHDEKTAQIAASKSAAELLFSTQSHRVKEMEEEIAKLQQQLDAQRSQVGNIISALKLIISYYTYQDCYISTDSDESLSSPVTLVHEKKKSRFIEKAKVSGC